MALAPGIDPSLQDPQSRVLPLHYASKTGSGTWIRTKNDGAKTRSFTVKLSPNKNGGPNGIRTHLTSIAPDPIRHLEEPNLTPAKCLLSLGREYRISSARYMVRGVGFEPTMLPLGNGFTDRRRTTVSAAHT